LRGGKKKFPQKLFSSYILSWVVQNRVNTILALNQLDLTEGLKRQDKLMPLVSDISFEQPGPGLNNLLFGHHCIPFQFGPITLFTLFLTNFLGLGKALDLRSRAFPGQEKHSCDIFTPKTPLCSFLIILTLV
jgi:hypothetical protein